MQVIDGLRFVINDMQFNKKCVVKMSLFSVHILMTKVGFFMHSLDLLGEAIIEFV